jgi:hypothetical protein
MNLGIGNKATPHSFISWNTLFGFLAQCTWISTLKADFGMKFAVAGIPAADSQSRKYKCHFSSPRFIELVFYKNMPIVSF